MSMCCCLPDQNNSLAADRELQFHCDSEIEPARFFTVAVVRDVATPIGLTLDLADGVSCVIVSVNPGVIHSWNRTAKESIVQTHDRIIKVNESCGDAQDLITRMRLDTELRLSIQRPQKVPIKLVKTLCTNYGIEVSCFSKSSSLLITKVNGGAMTQWNGFTSGPKVKRHDRIIEVNGIRGEGGDLLKLLGDETTVTLLCLCFDVAPILIPNQTIDTGETTVEGSCPPLSESAPSKSAKQSLHL